VEHFRTQQRIILNRRTINQSINQSSVAQGVWINAMLNNKGDKKNEKGICMEESYVKKR
jgi:hypothetical protein